MTDRALGPWGYEKTMAVTASAGALWDQSEILGVARFVSFWLIFISLTARLPTSGRVRSSSAKTMCGLGMKFFPEGTKKEKWEKNEKRVPRVFCNA